MPRPLMASTSEMYVCAVCVYARRIEYYCARKLGLIVMGKARVRVRVRVRVVSGHVFSAFLYRNRACSLFQLAIVNNRACAYTLMYILYELLVGVA